MEMNMTILHKRFHKNPMILIHEKFHYIVIGDMTFTKKEFLTNKKITEE